jgi:hypothetical protein
MLRSPQPVYLVMGVIFAGRERLDELEARMAASFGETEIRSEVFDFDVTDYYRDEMGPGLKRVFYGFKRLIDPGDIVDIKLAAVEIEEGLSREGRRRFNLDPGYMDFNKVILVSAKFLAQKVYLSKGVYADPTIYYDKGWKVYDWAFPDFRSGRYDAFFTEARRSYKTRIRQLSEEKNFG